MKTIRNDQSTIRNDQSTIWNDDDRAPCTVLKTTYPAYHKGLGKIPKQILDELSNIQYEIMWSNKTPPSSIADTEMTHDSYIDDCDEDSQVSECDDENEEVVVTCEIIDAKADSMDATTKKFMYT